MEQSRDFDILETPLEGVAAYWLSLKKLAAEKKNYKFIESEAEYTGEPYVKHLLKICFSPMPEPVLRRLAGFKREILLSGVSRKFDLMRIALLDIASNENPGKTLSKMSFLFPVPPQPESETLKLAQELMRYAERPGERARCFDVGHAIKTDRLMVTLLFYVLWARREGRMGCQPFMEMIGSRFFLDGLALVVDGFDGPFVRKRLEERKQAVMAEAVFKMDMSLEMCLGIRNKYSYEDIFAIAESFMI